METRREFLQKAAMLSGASAVWGTFPDSILKALAIDPEAGSTFMDAEHIVILMQENRSFDHTYGTLQGVRGYNDPRIHVQPNGNPVWLQTNTKNETYAPFRLDIKGTRATWMGSLPHSWTNQVDARNNGLYDKWLQAKPSGNKEYASMPLTLGFYNREDIPFYYAFADAFTICDQNFCSSLTGTTPNRLFLWTGTVRPTKDGSSFACVRNEEVDYGREASWTTFPERLEDAGIPWKIYQNEISLDSGFKGEEDAWLSNFTDNPIEWFTQFNVRSSGTHQQHMQRQAETLRGEIETLSKQSESADKNSADYPKLQDQLDKKKNLLKSTQEVIDKWGADKFSQLPQRDKNLHQKAFASNVGDPDYRSLTSMKYKDGDKDRTVQIPKGDVLHQFRKDVQEGNLPTVSWLVAPECFSDHPGSAWYGAWYLSEALEILTKNPEVWKKTIFILTYDENDGYFDHVPPFVAPHPDKPETGLVSDNMSTEPDYVKLEQDKKRRSASQARDSAIGLGFRVPMVVASPWSRGGCVCSEVFDHTSVLQFLEVFLSKKTGKEIKEDNISDWRRTVCGDMTSLFQPYNGEKIEQPIPVSYEAFVQSIHKAQFLGLPKGYKGLSAEEIKSPLSVMPKQEKGTRKAAPLPYQPKVVALWRENKAVALMMANGASADKANISGIPFNAYAYFGNGQMEGRSYAVQNGSMVTDSWPMEKFANSKYHVRVDGPNGFVREFKGSDKDPMVSIEVDYEDSNHPTGNLKILVENSDTVSRKIIARDNAYKGGTKTLTLKPGAKSSIVIDTSRSHRWYDVTITIENSDSFSIRATGHVETGQWSRTDPLMGGEV